MISLQLKIQGSTTTNACTNVQVCGSTRLSCNAGRQRSAGVALEVNLRKPLQADEKARQPQVSIYQGPFPLVIDE